MNPVDIAWAAGLYEGEGSFGAYPYPIACLVSTDQDVIERFAQIVGVGALTAPRIRISALGNKPQYEWRAQSLESSQYTACLFWSHLGIRRKKQIHDSLNHYKLTIKPKSGNTLAEQWFQTRYRDLSVPQLKEYHIRHKQLKRTNP